MSIRKRGKRYQVTYRVPGEATPRTETFKSEDEALIRDAQIRLAKQNGTFEPPVRQAKGKIAPKKDITVKEFMDEYVEVYGLKSGAILSIRPILDLSRITSSPTSEIAMSAP